ncbi:MAG: response regulator transcription factor [Deltaproteobacteria bacterium]|nr:response regulator transcription factor [Deltaproteobacteria bacterium]
MMDNGKKRILVIEDDDHIAEGLMLNLSLQGYEVIRAADGPSGLQQWKQGTPDMIVLDIMLPGIDGLSLLRSIRLSDERLPILVLSAKAASDDIIKGLSYGVDDYLAKPFNLEEFLLRVDRLLKRGDWTKQNATIGLPDETVYQFGLNRIDFSTNTAEGRKGEILLTEQEIKLLKLFMANPGKPLTRDELLEVGWGYTRKVTTRTVDNFIVRLRKYFEKDPKQPKFFKSIRSVGYVFDPNGAFPDKP